VQLASRGFYAKDAQHSTLARFSVTDKIFVDSSKWLYIKTACNVN